ncbi:MAG: zinc-binding dehydrogenase [Oscillospiraceae bacterium]|jgi:threonine dehydrogenase-like Zn-dependent dehydrogenase|nr:zinc-binding dehydrogenase [Oscillospiraceae bacterium]
MRTRAVRLYGKHDLRLEEFALPPLGDGEISARVVSDSLCMSSYKAAVQGEDHKRVPRDVAQNPVMIGHEFCGEILEVGPKWASKFAPGQKFVIQPALNYKGSLDAPGYSYPYIGGDATRIIIPNEVMEMDCLLPYAGEAFFGGSLAEPLSCAAGTFHAMYHAARGRYEHDMGIRAGGSMAILAGAGPMGLAALDYILHCARRPARLVVTDIDRGRLDRAAQLLPAEEAAKNGVTLQYLNGSGSNVRAALMDFSGNAGYDDVLVFAPLAALVELADGILGEDGCLNFFAGPSDPDFSAKFNFYNVHYAGTHVVGTSGGNTADIRECLDMMGRGLLNPAVLVTHIGGLDAVAEATLSLPKLSGGKKLIYTGIDMPLTAIADFEVLGKERPLFKRLHALCARHSGLWNVEAEKLLLDEKGGK